MADAYPRLAQLATGELMAEQSLTEDERAVLAMLADLVSYRTIAKRLGISWYRARRLGEQAEEKQTRMLADAGFVPLWIAKDA